MIAIASFLVAMPLTVMDSRGPGFFVDSNGWQGYEVAFVWPYFVVFLGAWWFIPIGFATAYILFGMWLPSAPRFVYILGAVSCCATLVLLPIFCIRDLRFEFVLLEASWGFAAISRFLSQPNTGDVSASAATPNFPSEST
ncbi:MAG: hypothetical protein JSS02_21810 [Planctomycetes bacterium]|nr:hypothetical protein [Planctomycetota bacterium]